MTDVYSNLFTFILSDTKDLIWLIKMAEIMMVTYRSISVSYKVYTGPHYESIFF